eukprot:6685158-Prymnesium_polylepis.1
MARHKHMASAFSQSRQDKFSRLGLGRQARAPPHDHNVKGSIRPPPNPISRSVVCVMATSGNEPPDRWYKKQRYAPSTSYVRKRDAPV